MNPKAVKMSKDHYEFLSRQLDRLVEMIQSEDPVTRELAVESFKKLNDTICRMTDSEEDAA
jgi:hypothetical protein